MFDTKTYFAKALLIFLALAPISHAEAEAAEDGIALEKWFQRLEDAVEDLPQDDRQEYLPILILAKAQHDNNYNLFADIENLLTSEQKAIMLRPLATMLSRQRRHEGLANHPDLQSNDDFRTALIKAVATELLAENELLAAEELARQIKSPEERSAVQRMVDEAKTLMESEAKASTILPDSKSSMPKSAIINSTSEEPREGFAVKLLRSLSTFASKEEIAKELSLIERVKGHSLTPAEAVQILDEAKAEFNASPVGSKWLLETRIRRATSVFCISQLQLRRQESGIAVEYFQEVFAGDSQSPFAYLECPLAAWFIIEILPEDVTVANFKKSLRGDQQSSQSSRTQYIGEAIGAHANAVVAEELYASFGDPRLRASLSLGIILGSEATRQRDSE